MLVIFKILVTLACAVSAAALILFVSKIISNRRSLMKFKRLTRGLPIMDDISILGNHINSMALGEENCRKFAEVHKKFGVNVGGLLGDKFVISTIDLDLIKRIIVDEGHLHLDRVSLHLPMKEYEESIMLVPGEQWKPIRRVFAPALKSNKFKAPNVLNEIEESIGKLIGHIERRLSKQDDLFEADDFAHKYSLDLVFSCFYKQYQAIDFDNPKDMWTGLIDSMLHAIQTSPMIKLSMIFPWFRRVVDWSMWHFHEQGFSRRKILEFVKLQTKLGMQARHQMNRYAREGKLKDANSFLLNDGTKFKRNIVDNIIDAFLDGKLSAANYFSSSCFLLAAADKTASDCIVHTLYLLSVHQDVQERLRESIKSDGAESDYLAWVLNESLRLMPPAPVGCSRTISQRIELKESGGQVIPAGTVVITNAYVIHRLKKYWGDDADEFKPERWQDTSKHHPMQFLSFGAGNRGCIGREFALFQMKMLFAALLTRYKFTGEHRDDAYKFNAPCLIFVIPNSPTFVKIKRLEDEA